MQCHVLKVSIDYGLGRLFLGAAFFCSIYQIPLLKAVEQLVKLNQHNLNGSEANDSHKGGVILRNFSRKA